MAKYGKEYVSDYSRRRRPYGHFTTLKDRIETILNEFKKLCFTSMANTLNPESLEQMVAINSAKTIFTDLEGSVDDIFTKIDENEEISEARYEELSAILNDIRKESHETNVLLRELIRKEK